MFLLTFLPGPRADSTAHGVQWRRTMCLRLLVATLVASGAWFSTGCGGVPVYKRAWLAKPAMSPMPNPQASGFENHVFEYREGSTGGTGIVGGGCGCN